MFYTKIKYPDGSFYVSVFKFVETFVFRINSYEDLWELNQIRDVFKKNGKNAKVIIPCLFDAQADRRFKTNESFNLKLICTFLNQMNWDKITIFHPHNSEEVEALIDNVEIMDNSQYITRVLDQLNEKYKIDGLTNLYNNLILMSSDAGGFKPLMKLCDNINWKGETASASKARNYNNGKTVLTQLIAQNNFRGKDILIIDDLCIYGGTFIGLAEMLKERNCGKIYLAISHLTVDKPNPKLFELFDCIFTANSKNLFYVNQKQNKPDNLKILNLF